MTKGIVELPEALQESPATLRWSTFACTPSRMASLTKVLAWRISIPISSPLSLSSAVMLGLSSMLLA